MPDGWEVYNGLNVTDSSDAGDDPDFDGLTNLAEYQNACDPNDNDTDDDGMPDGWEVSNALNPVVDDAAGDEDSDGLTNLARDDDTDDDGMPDGWEVFHSMDPLTNDGVEDPDLDGLTNLEEYQNGCDPNDNDTDSDGMPDGWEVSNGLSATLADSTEDPDSDGLANLGEYQNGCDPNDNDTDNDGLSDGDEVNIYHTNPKEIDTDYDLLSDGDEINTYHTNATNSDTDNDGIRDGYEVVDYGTDPTNPDTDGDGLSDGEEAFTYFTNPIKTDTDGDGLADGDEVLIYNTDPNSVDTDGDGYSDEWELTHGFDPLSDSFDVREFLTFHTQTLFFIGLAAVASGAAFRVRSTRIKRERRRARQVLAETDARAPEEIDAAFLDWLISVADEAKTATERGDFEQAQRELKRIEDILAPHEEDVASTQPDKLAALKQKIALEQARLSVHLNIRTAREDLDRLKEVAAGRVTDIGDYRALSGYVTRLEESIGDRLRRSAKLCRDYCLDDLAVKVRELSQAALREARVARRVVDEVGTAEKFAATPVIGLSEASMAEEAQTAGDIEVYRGCEIVGGQFEYKVKVRNTSGSVITNVVVSIVAYPSDCMELIGSDTKKIARIEVNGFRSPQFVFLPTKDCVEGTIHATVSYVDAKDQPHTVTVRPYTIKSVCDLLRPLERPVDEFEEMLEEMTSSTQEKTIQWNARVLFERSKTLLKARNFHLVDTDERVVGSQFMGMLRGLAEGKYTKRRVAVVITIRGEVDGPESIVTVRALGDDMSMLPTTIEELGARIDSWTCLRCGAPLGEEAVVIIKSRGTVKCEYCGHTLTLDLYKKQ
ncbi:MAG: binary toxin-like calcium binding domain-containing protein [Candidatus Thorarchaeota archaeon]